MKTKYIVILFLFFFSDVNADQYDPHLNDLFGQLQNYENQNEYDKIIKNHLKEGIVERVYENCGTAKDIQVNIFVLRNYRRGDGFLIYCGGFENPD